MKEFDAIIVGGGPCGSFSALTLARKGAKVIVCEEHRKIGVPKHCAGHISINGLKRLGMQLPPEIIENEIEGAIFYSPSGKKFEIRAPSPITYVINREMFDRHLSNLAVNLGARILLGSKVKSFHNDSSTVNKVTLEDGGVQRNLTAKIVVDAEGCQSRLLKSTGLPTLDHSMLVKGIQAEVDRVDDVDQSMVEVYLGREYAPGFFAWIIPRKNGSAKVGLATNTGNPREYLERFSSNHPVASRKLRKSSISSLSLHPISLGGPIPKTFSTGLLVVGDAASQVKPTTGGGLIIGLSCSKIAGEVAAEALASRDFSEAFLSRYQFRWSKLMGFDLKIMRRTRKLLNRLSDEELDKIVILSKRLGLDIILEETGDLDFQGRSLLNMVRHPKALAIMLYFIFVSMFSPYSNPKYQIPT